MPGERINNWHEEDFYKVQSTLELYDPRRQVIVIGTAALVLQGIKVPYRLEDVDALASNEFITSLRRRVKQDHLNDTTRLTRAAHEDYKGIKGSFVLLEPNPLHEDASNLLKFQAFTDFTDEKYQMDLEKAQEHAYPHKKSGRMVLSPDVLLEWKNRVGRPKDHSFTIDKLFSN